MLIRFGVTGLLGVLTQLVTLYVLTEWAHLWYIHSAVCAWLVAFGVSFGLQRRWTFGRQGRAGAAGQLVAFVALFLANMGINAALLYALVDLLGAPYLIAQFGLLVLIAVWNFFIMRYLIFRERRGPE